MSVALSRWLRQGSVAFLIGLGISAGIDSSAAAYGLATILEPTIRMGAPAIVDIENPAPIGVNKKFGSGIF